MTISIDCTDEQDIRGSYELSYATDSRTLNTICAVDGSECINGVCHHELQNNIVDSRCQPPVSQFTSESVTVSVTARNIVGKSNPAMSGSLSEFLLSLNYNYYFSFISLIYMCVTKSIYIVILDHTFILFKN